MEGRREGKRGRKGGRLQEGKYCIKIGKEKGGGRERGREGGRERGRDGGRDGGTER